MGAPAVKVRELMTTAGVLTVREHDDLALATQMMLWGAVHHLPVLRDGRVVGMLSDRDVLAVRAAEGADARRLQVCDAMTEGCAVAGPDDDILAAASAMARDRVGCLPIVDGGGALLGVLSRADVLAHLDGGVASARRELTVAHVMRREVTTVRGDEDLVDAARRMLDGQLRHLPVTDGDSKVIGILADRDVRTALGDPRRPLHDEALRNHMRVLRVWSAMTTPVCTVHPDTPLADAAEALVERRIGALPVVDGDGRLVGLVSYSDVLAALFPHAHGHTGAGVEMR